jgi:aldose sugar dehydrogenase
MRSFLAICSAIALTAVAVAQRAGSRQTFAPHELKASAAPSAIVWETPEIAKGPINFESADERRLRLVVMTRDLEQPWSIAFLPDGSLLVTERAGRIRRVRNGKLDREPVPGVPVVHTGGEGNLQGLMDIALHPRFAENHWVYFTYHKPTPSREGATTLARATWNGNSLSDVRDIFESHATGTEASRIVFGRDGMIYMSISAPGTGLGTKRAQRPGDYAGKIIRLRDDGSIPRDNPFVGRSGYKPAIFLLDTGTVMASPSILKRETSGRRSRGRAAVMS